MPAVAAAAAAMGADALADGGAAHCNQMRFYISETFPQHSSVFTRLVLRFFDHFWLDGSYHLFLVFDLPDARPQTQFWKQVWSSVAEATRIGKGHKDWRRLQGLATATGLD